MIVDILRDGIIVERVIIMAIIFLNGYFIPRQLLPSPRRMHLLPNFIPMQYFREDPLLDPHGRQQGLDAGHFLQEREDRSLPQHPDPQPVHPGVSRWRCPLQHQVSFCHLSLSFREFLQSTRKYQLVLCNSFFRNKVSY